MNTRLLPRSISSPVVFLAVAAALFLVLVALRQVTPAPPLAHAQTTDLGCLSGYAWSDNIGWIDFTCSNVPVRSSGTIEGYAWANPSDDVALTNNIGWISFNPADTATCGAAARITGTALSGWAKAISADGNGWDGCISLSGSSPSYGVTLSGGTGTSGGLTGYAWGSDVVGWIDFAHTTGNSGITFTTTYIPGPSGPTPLLQGPTQVRKGTTATLTYTVTSPSVEGCTIVGINGYNSGVLYPTDGVPGSVTTTAINANTRFTLTCGTAVASITVGIIPIFQEI